MKNKLQLGESRDEILSHASSAVKRIWESFDVAREVEPNVSEAVQELLLESLPETGTSKTSALSHGIEILDQSLAQSRPRFLAYIGSSGLEIGAIADFLVASYDINVAIDSKAASLMELQTSKWLSEFIGYTDGKGLFTSGGTVSNITALAAARQKVNPNSREFGSANNLVVYCSSEAHYSNKRAVELLGLGSRSLRPIPIDEHHKMRVDLLEEQISTDLSENKLPMAIIASAGTTLTGAVDSLSEIARVAKKYRIWLHVDGAYGAPAAGTSSVAGLFDGLNSADSITIDAHKWLFVPKACSVLLVKDMTLLEKTFGHHEAYMPHEEATLNPVDHTLEYSRPLRALKLWLGFKAHGAAEFRKAIEDNIELARLTYQRGLQESRIQTLDHPPQLSIVPIRHIPKPGVDINNHNSQLCQAIIADGRVFISPAVIEGEVWLRPCFTNFRTHESDVDVLFQVIKEISVNLH